MLIRSQFQTIQFWRQLPRELTTTEGPSSPPLTALEKWRAENKRKSAPTVPSPKVASKSKSDSSSGKEADEAAAAAIAAKQWEESGYQEYMEDQRRKGWKT